MCGRLILSVQIGITGGIGGILADIGPDQSLDKLVVSNRFALVIIQIGYQTGFSILPIVGAIDQYPYLIE